jgi:prepilin-type N-terminal cleavage/methylation domain-containing protein
MVEMNLISERNKPRSVRTGLARLMGLGKPRKRDRPPKGGTTAQASRANPLFSLGGDLSRLISHASSGSKLAAEGRIEEGMQAGLNRWFTTNLRGRKGQQGFTLIELLVVVTILGILAGIVTLSLVGLTTNANVQACRQEYNTVQTAIDALMADNNVTTVTAQAAPTNDMTRSITGSGGYALFINLSSPPSGSKQTRNYTRNGTTQFYYTWDGFGKINGISKSSSATDKLDGCTPKV